MDFNSDHSPAPAEVQAELLKLEQEVAETRRELATLRADLAQAQAQVDSHHVQQLLEANEHLVVEAMQSRGMAESAAQLVAELTRSSELDALTNLPNRLLLIDRFTQALTHAKRHDGRLAMLFIDLDRFKEINDTSGHSVGDAVLRGVSHCLVACVREADTVCRLGGDEFVLLLTEIAGVTDPGLVAEKLLRSLAQLTVVDGFSVEVTASIGISVFPDDADDIENLVDRADQAMYRSKRAGGNTYRFFSTQRGESSHAPAQAPSGGTRIVARNAHLLEANQNLVLSALSASMAAEQKERLLAELQLAATNKDEFLSVLGHELRNPLAPLVTTLDVMRLRASGVETIEHATMRRHLSHLVRLVDDLQDVAKIASGKVDLHVGLVSIMDVALQAIAMAKPVLEQRRHRFRFDEAQQRLICRGDPVRLAQCVSNLLINAAKYTPPGGQITLTTRQQAGMLEISVKDDGRGISAEALPQVFSLFFQERIDAQQADGGLGVGLALVRSLVALHAGTVTAQSEGLGKGSQFIILLPLVNPAAEAATPASVAPARRILIVDDNYDAADSLSMLLRIYGHQVWVATHPVAALSMVGNISPDLALLDIGLPGMDGYELARRIRQDHPGLAMAMVALSGFGRAVDQANSSDSRFDAHLLKPVDISDLEHVLVNVHFSPRPQAQPR